MFYCMSINVCTCLYVNKVRYIVIFVVSKVTLTVVKMCSISGEHAVSVLLLLLVSVTGNVSDSLEAQTVSLALLTWSTSLLSDSTPFFFNAKDSSYLYLLPSLLLFFFAYYLELCNIVTFIFIFNFKTQLAIIRVFRFINCFPFLIPNELTKYQAS